VTLVDDVRDLEQAWDLARRDDNRPIHDLLYVALAEPRRTAPIDVLVLRATNAREQVSA